MCMSENILRELSTDCLFSNVSIPIIGTSFTFTGMLFWYGRDKEYRGCQFVNYIAANKSMPISFINDT
jgi:hypothetical protein